MKAHRFSLVLAICLLASAAVAAPPDPKLVALVERANKEATHLSRSSGINEELRALEQSIVAFGPAAVPLMVPLLAHRNEGVRTYAGYVVRSLDGLTPKELPALIAAHRGGNGWIAPAIGRVGTREAVAFLVTEFRRAPVVHGQLDWALIKLGGRAAAPLADSLRGLASPPETLVDGACHVFREMKEGAAGAEPVLLARAQAPKASLEAKAAAVNLLGCLTEVHASTRTAVDALADADPKLAPLVGHAAYAMKTERGVQYAMDEARRIPERVGMLASLGPAARRAEPLAVEFLTHSAPTVRLFAIWALGEIGTVQSAPALVRFLTDPVDWRATCAAARALGALGATKHVAALQAVGRDHWYPPVRECARVAAERLVAGSPPEPQWDQWDVPNGAKWRWAPPPGEPDPMALAPDALARADVPSERQGKTLRIAAQLGLTFANGVLLGTNHGEWGGRLVWSGPRGEKNLLARDFEGDETLMASNVVALHSFGAFAVSLHGLAHMSIDEGSAYRIERAADGTVTATLWRVLPGAPRTSVRLANGSLFISCRGGDVFLAPDGTLRMAAGPTP